MRRARRSSIPSRALRLGRDDDDGDVLEVVLEREELDLIEPVQVGHHDVHQDQIGLRLLGPVEGAQALGRRRDLVALVGQDVREHADDERVIVHDQDAAHSPLPLRCRRRSGYSRRSSATVRSRASRVPGSVPGQRFWSQNAARQPAVTVVARTAAGERQQGQEHRRTAGEPGHQGLRHGAEGVGGAVDVTGAGGQRGEGQGGRLAPGPAGGAVDGRPPPGRGAAPGAGRRGRRGTS